MLNTKGNKLKISKVYFQLMPSLTCYKWDLSVGYCIFFNENIYKLIGEMLAKKG